MEDVRKFATSIKKKYQERRINCEKQWPPCHSDKIVRLEIVEGEKGEGYSANTQRGREDKGIKRTSIAYSDLFKEESGKRPVRKVLLEGDAGIGKTTLCISVSEDWANGRLFQQFELVLLLPLRMKVVASAGSLPELLKLLHPSPRLCDSVAKYLEDSEDEGESVLIIADGWDEISESERQEESFLFQLLFEQFPLMSVVLTSRPSASASLHQLPCIDQFVEVCGFSKEHSVEYIRSEFASDQEKAGRLLEQLESNPLVESVCSVPLNCAIVCHLWRTLEESLPTTMTELYTKIILLLILRNIRKIDTYRSTLNLPNFDALPAGLQQSWWLLCEFAFQALEKDQLVFSQEELEEFFPQGLALDKRILCFGLLQSAESIGYGISFHFLHLTFQEYLAALHLARQSPDKQLAFFQSQKSIARNIILYSRNRFRVVNRFFFGINHFVDDFINSFICQIFECIAIRIFNLLQNIMSLCHCVFEAQYDLIDDQLAQYLVGNPSSVHISKIVPLTMRAIYFSPHTAHDCTAVLHAIAKIQECALAEINFDNCGIRENQIKRFIDILANKKGKLLIVDLNLARCRLTVSAAGLQTLQDAVCGDLLANLEVVDLSGSLTSDAVTNATFIEALSAHCRFLTSLDLSDNNIGVPGASAISRMYDHSIDDDTCYYRYKKILPRKIFLNRTNIGDNGFVTLIKSFEVMRDLKVMGNDIHAFGVSFLADAVCSGKLKLDTRHASDLHLSDNPLGLQGSTAVGRILSSSHCQLISADFSRCELTTAGVVLPNTESLNISNAVTSEAMGDIGQQLCQMPQSSTIWRLKLDGNSFIGEGIYILAGFIHLCPSITYLHTNDCGITSDDLILLLDRLTQLKCSSSNLCYKLKEWHLQNNQIDDSGVSALINHLPSLFPRLKYVDVQHILENNQVSSEMVKKLEEGIKCREVLSSDSDSENCSESDFRTSSDPLPPTPPQVLSSDSDSENCSESDFRTSSDPLPPTPPYSPPWLSSLSFLNDSVESAEQLEDHLESSSDTGSDASLDLRAIASSKHVRGSQQCNMLTIANENQDTEAILKQDKSEGAMAPLGPIVATPELDLKSPQSEQPEEDFTSLTDIEHHFVDLIKWESENGVKRELRIYAKIAHKWRQIATRLGFELGEIESIRKNYPFDDNDRIHAVLRRWFEKARNLPNASRYPKSWQGLINLLEDAELGEVAEELKKTLSSPQNSIRGNLS